jgi:hypothetical protein
MLLKLRLARGLRRIYKTTFRAQQILHYHLTLPYTNRRVAAALIAPTVALLAAAGAGLFFNQRRQDKRRL